MPSNKNIDIMGSSPKANIRSILTFVRANDIRLESCIHRGKNIPIFFNRIFQSKKSPDILSYSKKYPDVYYRTELTYGNDSYGIGSAIRSFSGYKHNIKANCEHGLILGERITPGDCIVSGLPGVITMSPYRKSILQKRTGLPVLSVGPYIRYVDGLLDEISLKDIRRKLGKIGLVFPAHSTHASSQIYDFKNLSDTVMEIKETYNINTILVCLYFRDISQAAVFEKQGFDIVCAGHSHDPSFLKRLRTLIELSTVTISNSIGTHIGYSIALGRPHFLIDMGSTLKIETSERVNELVGLTFDQNQTYYECVNEVKDAFRKHSLSITSSQLEVVEKYWGLSNIKTPTNIYLALEIFENLFRLNRKMTIERAIELLLNNEIYHRTLVEMISYDN